jgi:hypothetical protein
LVADKGDVLVKKVRAVGRVVEVEVEVEVVGRTKNLEAAATERPVAEVRREARNMIALGWGMMCGEGT